MWQQPINGGSCVYFLLSVKGEVQEVRASAQVMCYHMAPASHSLLPTCYTWTARGLQDCLRAPVLQVTSMTQAATQQGLPPALPQSPEEHTRTPRSHLAEGGGGSLDSTWPVAKACSSPVLQGPSALRARPARTRCRSSLGAARHPPWASHLPRAPQAGLSGGPGTGCRRSWWPGSRAIGACGYAAAGMACNAGSRLRARSGRSARG